MSNFKVILQEPMPRKVKVETLKYGDWFCFEVPLSGDLSPFILAYSAGASANCLSVDTGNLVQVGKSSEVYLLEGTISVKLSTAGAA